MKIVIYGNPVLETPALKVTEFFTEGLELLTDEMFRIMEEARGIGLAAPQIGIGLQLAVVDLTKATGNMDSRLVLINPEIVNVSKETNISSEGCLSLPGASELVTRPKEVTVRYQDITGIVQHINADGIFAKCLVHEIEHLSGKLYVDHLGWLAKNVVLRRFNKVQKIRRRLEEQKKNADLSV